MNKPREEILRFMDTPAYWGLNFNDFVKMFKLSDKELIDLVQTYDGQSPYKIKRDESGQIYIL